MAIRMPGIGIRTGAPSLLPRASIGAPPPVRVGMTIDQMKGYFFRPDRILHKLDAASARAFRKFGARVRLTARHSLRKVAGPAPRGHAPHSHGQHLLRNHIYYALPSDESHVVIGPALLIGRGVGLSPYGSHTVPQVQEFGAAVTRQGNTRPKAREVFSYSSASGGVSWRTVKPIREDSRGLLAYDYDKRAVRFFSAGRMANRGTYQPSTASPTRHYGKRPYMGPAFKRELPRAQDLWVNSIR